MSLSILDIKKVVDQTVRDIKREVNRSILKVPEIEIKTLDATNNEPWGPHGSLLKEIAQASYTNHEMYMILGILWKRLEDTGKNWRHVYKGLIVLDFLIANGSDVIVNEIRENAFLIQRLLDFHHLEPDGKDQGINVRKKAESLLALVKNKEKIVEAREKASINKDKYSGMSSMSSRSSFGSNSNYNDDKYYSDRTAEYNYYNDKYDDDRDYKSSKDAYHDNQSRRKDEYEYKRDERSQHSANESKEQYSTFKDRSTSVQRSNRANQVLEPPAYSDNQNTSGYSNPNDNYRNVSFDEGDDDFDDFDPRATTPKNPPVQPPSQPSTDFFSPFPNNQSQEDLFANARFQAAPPAPQNSPFSHSTLNQPTTIPPPSSYSTSSIPGPIQTTPLTFQAQPNLFESPPSLADRPPVQQTHFANPSGVSLAPAFPIQAAPSFPSQPNPQSSSPQTLLQPQNLLDFSSPSNPSVNKNTSIDNDFDFNPRNSSPLAPSNSLTSLQPPPASSTVSQTNQNPKPAKPTVWDDVLSKGLLDLNIKAVNDPFKDLGISMPTSLAAAKSGSLKTRQEEVKPQPSIPIGMASMNSMRLSGNYGFQ